MLRLKRDKYALKVNYKLEYLPDDFIVYKKQLDMGYWWRRLEGIPAKDAKTNCCDATPLKYTPYPEEENPLWWLICSGCNYAIKANGSVY